MKKAVTGGQEVIDNINRAIKGIEGRTQKGLIRAAIMVMKSMEKVAPVIPVDTGNLRASRFLVTKKGAGAGVRGGRFKDVSMKPQHEAIISKYTTEAKAVQEPLVILGFSANYASYVHENLEATFKRPNAGAKFLQAAMVRERHNMLRMIQKEARIKK